MLKQNIFIIKLRSLYDIFYEVKNLLNYDIYEIKDKDFDIEKNINYKNSIFITDNLKKTQEIKNIDNNRILILDHLPIPFKKLTEKINILFLKTNYQLKSEINIKEYVLNLNNRTIKKAKKNVKLTEKELEIILFLSKNNKPQNITKLQNEIWKYNSDLETHTVETHVYRLRKKIELEFNDIKFINSDKEGYTL
jgi:DNA-binding response OmpR family regulator